MVNSRKLGLFGAAMAVALVSSGCVTATPGAAAIVGDTRITERQLTSQVEQVLKAQGRPVDSASEALVVTTLDRMITALLVEQIAEEQGITITRGELDATIVNYAEASGGRQAFEDALLAQDLAPDDIEELFRVNILAQKMGMILDPGGTPDSQSASIFAAVAAYSEEVGTEVSPRYGSWDPAGLVVGPPPNDLSAPIQFS
jgi:PBP1b-binding outer membrane lipoprotein LpoB